MSLNERDLLIVIVVCSVVGFLLFILIICSCFWLIIRHYRSKSRSLTMNDDNDSAIVTTNRTHYQRAKKLPQNKIEENRRRRKGKRYNTNESAITLSFDPPHLINQNVKNLEQLIHNENTLAMQSYPYDDYSRQSNHSSSEPVYASSSTVVTSISNYTVPMTPTTNIQQRFLNELDQVLKLKNDESSAPSSKLKYSQSYRQYNEPLPFDFHRSSSPKPFNNDFLCNQHRSPYSLYIRTTDPSNNTLIRKARLGRLTDDTAILY